MLPKAQKFFKTNGGSWGRCGTSLEKFQSFYFILGKVVSKTLPRDDP